VDSLFVIDEGRYARQNGQWNFYLKGQVGSNSNIRGKIPSILLLEAVRSSSDFYNLIKKSPMRPGFFSKMTQHVGINKINLVTHQF